MANKSFMLAKPLEAEEAFEYLRANLRSTKVTSITYDPNMKRVDIGGRYHNYQLSFYGNQVTVATKIVQKWSYIIIACAVTGLFLFIPFIIAIVIAFIANSEISELTTLFQQTLNMKQ